MAKAAVKSDCCLKFGKSNSCSEKQNNKKDNSDTRECSMMLTCGICGFLATEPLAVKPLASTSVEKPVLLYIIGNLPAYSSSDWKPPKV